MHTLRRRSEILHTSFFLQVAYLSKSPKWKTFLFVKHIIASVQGNIKFFVLFLSSLYLKCMPQNLKCIVNHKIFLQGPYILYLHVFAELGKYEYNRMTTRSTSEYSLPASILQYLITYKLYFVCK